MQREHLDYEGPSHSVTPRRFRKAALGLAGVALLVAATLAAMVGWVMNAPAVPRSSLARLQAGMSAQQVTQLLGTPDKKNVKPDGSQTWRYSRMTWAYLTIYFDAKGTVAAFNHDR